MTQITEHLAEIKRRMESSLDRSGRRGETVTLVAIAKRHPAEAIRSAAAAGLTDFGENYLQEAVAKMDRLEDLALRWHFVGQIQANKTRQIAEHFDWVDTVDRIKIADRLNAQRPESLPPLNVLIQLNLDDEPQKGGVGESGLLPLADRIAELPRLKLRGVMTIPPADQDVEAKRASFLAAASAASALRSAHHGVDTVSMGMSEDFELAIECGSTCIRIGTALFGPRPS